MNLITHSKGRNKTMIRKSLLLAWLELYIIILHLIRKPYHSFIDVNWHWMSLSLPIDSNVVCNLHQRTYTPVPIFCNIYHIAFFDHFKFLDPTYELVYLLVGGWVGGGAEPKIMDLPQELFYCHRTVGIRNIKLFVCQHIKYTWNIFSLHKIDLLISSVAKTGYVFR